MTFESQRFFKCHLVQNIWYASTLLTATCMPAAIEASNKSKCYYYKRQQKK